MKKSIGLVTAVTAIPNLNSKLGGIVDAVNGRHPKVCFDELMPGVRCTLKRVPVDLLPRPLKPPTRNVTRRTTRAPRPCFGQSHRFYATTARLGWNNEIAAGLDQMPMMQAMKLFGP